MAIYLVPTIQSLYLWVKKSVIILRDGCDCAWIGYGGRKSFQLQLNNSAAPLALGCIASLTNKLDWVEDFPDLSFITESQIIKNNGTLAALKTIKALKHIEISIAFDNILVIRFLSALSGAGPNIKDDPIPFPVLQCLRLGQWKSDVDEIIEAVKQRYSTERPEPLRPRCKLRLNFTPSKAWWFRLPTQPRAIVNMEKIKHLRSIDGVESVRFGCLEEQPGMMAVVWSEGESQVVWG